MSLRRSMEQLRPARTQKIDLQEKVQSATIYKDERFSDHAPLIIDYDYPLS